MPNNGTMVFEMDSESTIPSSSILVQNLENIVIKQNTIIVTVGIPFYFFVLNK